MLAGRDLPVWSGDHKYGPLLKHILAIDKPGALPHNFSVVLPREQTNPTLSSFHVPDILPHLSHDSQDTKKMSDAIKGESLDIVIGSIPV